MADDQHTAARRRVDAIGSQLPAITRVAGPSNGPRAQDKVVIITGANSALGIGRATAHQFAQNGARAIYLCDLDDEHLGAQKVELESLGCQIHTRQMDAADEGQVQAVVDDALRRYGRLDVFFANAGITGMNVVFTELTDADFMEVLRANTLR